MLCRLTTTSFAFGKIQIWAGQDRVNAVIPARLEWKVFEAVSLRRQHTFF
jgi:hypothetical protein